MSPETLDPNLKGSHNAEPIRTSDKPSTPEIQPRHSVTRREFLKIAAVGSTGILAGLKIPEKAVIEPVSKFAIDSLPVNPEDENASGISYFPVDMLEVTDSGSREALAASFDLNKARFTPGEFDDLVQGANWAKDFLDTEDVKLAYIGIQANIDEADITTEICATATAENEQGELTYTVHALHRTAREVEIDGQLVPANSVLMLVNSQEPQVAVLPDPDGGDESTSFIRVLPTLDKGITQGIVLRFRKADNGAIYPASFLGQDMSQSKLGEVPLVVSHLPNTSIRIRQFNNDIVPEFNKTDGLTVLSTLPVRIEGAEWGEGDLFYPIEDINHHQGWVHQAYMDPPSILMNQEYYGYLEAVTKGITEIGQMPKADDAIVLYNDTENPIKLVSAPREEESVVDINAYFENAEVKLTDDAKLATSTGSYTVHYSERVLQKGEFSSISDPNSSTDEAYSRMLAKAGIQTGSTVKLSAFSQRGGEMASGGSIEGTLNTLRQYVVVPEEFKKVQDQMKEAKVKYIEYMPLGKPPVNSLAYFEGDNLVVITQIRGSYTNPSGWKEAVLLDGPASAAIFLIDGSKRARVLNVDEVYFAYGCTLQGCQNASIIVN